VSLVLAAIGAINWGLIGLFRWNLVDAILGGGAYEITSPASRVVYVIVGLAGLASLALLRSFDDRREGTGRSAPGPFDRQQRASL
jgi:uncharacterized membrane protein YuzA (DUF378 family)